MNQMTDIHMHIIPGVDDGSGSIEKSSFDPDDHDIEAYFEDNRDEYDDYDDAYEGFLDE